VSVIIFKENINLISIFSITLIIIGVVLLNVFGSGH
ncbi:quaternary ammonium compound efflux SMR transporter QacJ, partial [Staphylococcus pseudintermedius]